MEECCKRHGGQENASWVEQKLYGIEKDYRLARVSKISLFMHGAGTGNIIFGDGLENYRDKNILPNTFDILVANPPYSVSAFKPHLKLKDNDFSILSKISNTGSEIETLFAERIAQLVKPMGVAAVILPSSILNKENESFIAARESLLTNFRICAIAQFGSKTFGATGTNTIILFLQKYDEPPKRIDLVADSVQAILEHQTLSDWEDKDILTGYLEKIGVEIESYQAFLKRERDYTAWSDMPYFSMYVAAFRSSAEYLNKERQKSFIQSSEAEKMQWCNQHFYDFAIARESEKLTYFALCYRQTTLIITAPSDNSGQETFLGYTWSNRKGQEGIQVKKEGGLLYCSADRTDENTLAALVRSSFSGTRGDIAKLEPYYYWLPLKNMLDFSGVEFNKAIRISAISEKAIRIERLFPTEQLERIVDINLETFDPHVDPEGKYCYVDIGSIESNQIDYSNMITGGTAPSRARRIAKEGDVLISTVRPNLKGFSIVKDMPKNAIFSTGFAILSSKDTNVILNQFIYLLFMYDTVLMEQICSKMGKGSYPSINQNDIKKFYILVPPIKQQQQIIKEFHAIDEQIKEQEAMIEKCDEDVKSRFVEMFGDNTYPKVKAAEVCDFITKGTTPASKDILPREEENTVPYLKVYNLSFTGDLLFRQEPQYISREIHEGKLARSKVYPNDVLMNIVGPPLGKFALVSDEYSEWNINQAIAIFRAKEKILPKFLLSALMQEKVIQPFIDQAVGVRQLNISLEQCRNLELILPPLDEQKKYVSFVEQVDKSKSEAQHRKEVLILEREQTIEKYFR